jgi:signal transduction histidine kinase
LRTSVEDDLPAGVADERRLTQVLLNLVGNAIKFTDKGGVDLGVTRVGGDFEFRIVDTGPGISEENQARIVEMHGGRISVQSRLGQGATFTVRIPINCEMKRAAE